MVRALVGEADEEATVGIAMPVRFRQKPVAYKTQIPSGSMASASMTTLATRWDSPYAPPMMQTALRCRKQQTAPRRMPHLSLASFSVRGVAVVLSSTVSFCQGRAALPANGVTTACRAHAVKNYQARSVGAGDEDAWRPGYRDLAWQPIMRGQRRNARRRRNRHAGTG